jgi:TetR/AcrR family transcriptional regulator, transcriptional repressor for nem operon
MDTKEKLITTAAALFLSKGYAAAATAEICTLANVNKGSFYHFFSSKADLLLAALQPYVQAINEEFQRIARLKDTPEKKIFQLFDVPTKTNMAWQRAHGCVAGCFVGNVVLELASHEDSVRSAALSAFQTWAASIEPIVIEFKKLHDLKHLNTFTTSELVICMMQGGILIAKAHNDPKRISLMAPAAIAAMHAQK